MDRRRRGPADAGADPLVRRLDEAAGSPLPGRQPSRRADEPRAGREDRHADAGAPALLRPRDRRRRPGGAGRRGLRRLGGAAHAARRAQRARRPGRHQLPDRELSRIPVRRQRSRPRAPRRSRRRAASAPRCSRRRWWPCAARIPTVSSGSRTGRTSRATRSSSPRACPCGRWRFPESSLSSASASTTAPR